MQSEMVRNISLIRYLFVQMGIRDKINIHKWFIIDNMVKILPLRYPIASPSFLHSSAHERACGYYTMRTTISVVLHDF